MVFTMSPKQYKKVESQVVTGVQLSLETDGFCYTKWGGEQHCKAGDWLINNNGECYTVEQESFADTYTEVAPGQFAKTNPIWAKQAETDGFVKTKEGKTAYHAGDYLVSNNEDGTDAYAISQEKFEKSYIPVNPNSASD